MLQQHESDVLTMMQEASQWDFGGDDPTQFINGYMSAIKARRGYQYSDMLMWACALIQKGEAPGVSDEINNAVVQMLKEEGRPAEAPGRVARTTLEARVLADYEEVKGKILMVTGGITGYVGEEQVDIDRGGVPLIVRVLHTDRPSLLRWMDGAGRQDCIDPAWNVELLNHPEDLPEGLRVSWMYGRSHHLDGRIEMFKGQVLPGGIHAFCPADPNHQEFKTVATVMQDWKVNSHGDFIEEVANVQVIMEPNTGQEWVCAICGKTADVINV